MWRKSMTDTSTTTLRVADAAHKRLDRIEEKIDKLTDIMISIARVEEKQLGDSEEIKHILRRMETADAKANGVEARVDKTEVRVSLISKVFWSAVVATVVAAVGYNSK